MYLQSEGVKSLALFYYVYHLNSLSAHGIYKSGYLNSSEACLKTAQPLFCVGRFLYLAGARER